MQGISSSDHSMNRMKLPAAIIGKHSDSRTRRAEVTIESPQDATLVRRELVWYVAITYASSYVFAVLAARHGGLSSFPALPLAMLVPWIAAVVVGRFARRPAVPPSLGFRIGRVKYWIIAPLAMLVLWACVFAISYAVHPAAYIGGWAELTVNVGKLRNIPPVGGTSTRLGLAYLLTIVVGPVLNIPIFLGEEVGWRGFMVPRLVALFGRRGLIIGGCIWALWHTPFILIGQNYPDHPLLGHLIWVPFCIAFGIILQTVYVRSRSIFPTALCHGLTNQFAMLTLSVFAVQSRFIDLLDGPAGVVAVVILTVPAVWCYRRFPLRYDVAPFSDPWVKADPDKVPSAVGRDALTLGVIASV